MMCQEIGYSNCQKLVADVVKLHDLLDFCAKGCNCLLRGNCGLLTLAIDSVQHFPIEIFERTGSMLGLFFEIFLGNKSECSLWCNDCIV